MGQPHCVAGTIAAPGSSPPNVFEANGDVGKPTIHCEIWFRKLYTNISVSEHLWCRMVKKSTTTSDPLRSLADFIQAFEQYSSSTGYLKCYRGQRDSTWPSVAGILRPEFENLLENEKRAVRDLISVQPHEFASDETMFDKLVRMQHFGLPTRLLDVSRNALVALYFATEPSPRGSKPSDGMVTAFAIPPEREKYFDR